MVILMMMKDDPPIRRVYKYQTSSIDEVFHGLGQKDDLKLLRMHHSLSLSPFFFFESIRFITVTK